MIIRPATVADLPRLVVLVQQEIAYQRQLKPFFDLVPHIDWGHFMQRKLQNPSERVLVAERDEQLVGYIDVRAPYHASPPRSLRASVRRLLGRRPTAAIVQPRNVGWIEDCYVAPQVRRQGVGRALVQAGLTWLQARSVKHVELAVLVVNREGMTFWEKQGFAPVRLLMSREIDDRLTLG